MTKREIPESVHSSRDWSARLQTLSRRTFLGAGVGGVAAAGVARAQSQGPPSDATGARPRNDLLALVNRTTQGQNIIVLDQAESLGYTGWLERQLDHENLDDSLLDAILVNLPTLTMSGKDLHDTYIASGLGPEQVIFELDIANVVRALFSERQLYERMVEFWTDHFNIYHFLPGVDVLKTVDDREVVRKHALGKFPELLRASAKSGAMMIYLDNAVNIAGIPNENYARELLELHTVGVNGGYTENDVVELARALTGWTLYPETEAQYGEHLFYPPFHDDGEKVIMGQYLPPGGGSFDVEFMLTYLAGHPKTAERISREIASWLLVSDPPDTVVDAGKSVYMATGGDIKEVVRAVLSPASLAAAHPESNPKLRRPYHFMTSLFRATFPDYTDVVPMIVQLANMGQMPYTWPAPNGFPDDLVAWGSAVRPRWELASLYFDGQFPGVAVSDATLAALVGPLPQPNLAASINYVLAGGGLSPEDEADVQAFIDAHAFQTNQVLREAFALAASAPSFQLF